MFCQINHLLELMCRENLQHKLKSSILNLYITIGIFIGRYG